MWYLVGVLVFIIIILILVLSDIQYVDDPIVRSGVTNQPNRESRSCLESRYANLAVSNFVSASLYDIHTGELVATMNIENDE